MAIQDAIKRRIGKMEELKQRIISQDDYGYGHQTSDPYRQQRLDALAVPGITNFDPTSVLGPPPMPNTLQAIQLPAVNIAFPNLEQPQQQQQVVQAPQQQQPQYSGGGGGNYQPQQQENEPPPAWNERTPQGNYGSSTSPTRMGQYSQQEWGNKASDPGGTGLKNSGYFKNSNLLSQNQNQSQLLSNQRQSSNNYSGGGYSSFGDGPYNTEY